MIKMEEKNNYVKENICKEEYFHNPKQNPTINNQMKNYGVNGRQFIYEVKSLLLII